MKDHSNDFRISFYSFVGSFGRLGHGSENDETIPRPVSSNKRFVAVACGGYHTVALTSTSPTYLIHTHTITITNNDQTPLKDGLCLLWTSKTN